MINIRKHLRIYKEFIKMNISSAMIYRSSFWLSTTFEFIAFIIFIMFINVIYSHVHTIAGFSYLEMILYYSIWQIINSIYIIVFYSSLFYMVNDIRTGIYDFVLTKPVDAQFLSSFRFIEIQRIFNLLSGVALFLYAIVSIGSIPWTSMILFFMILLIMGLYLYSMITLFMTTYFWLYGFNHIILLINFILRLVAYPPHIYTGFIRFVLFYIIPVGFILATPFETLIRNSQTIYTTILIGFIGIISIYLTRKVFLFGLKHYSSASS